jgi:hypothetical protein
MAEFIVNPRRAPRAPARCRAAVVTPAGAFEAETEDVGARGCQVVSPKLVKKGDPVRVTLSADRVPEELRVAGKAAWVSAQPPWRVGIAFGEAHVHAGELWFERLVAASPGLGAFRRVPEKISLDATVYLGPPPRFLLDFTAEEAALLRAIASGARLDELKVRLRDRWPAAQCALFSLLARQAVTLSRGHAAHPDAWKKVLTEVEATLAVESLGTAAPSLVAPPEPPRPAGTPLPARRLATPPPPPRPAPTPFSASGPGASPWGTPARDPHPVLELPDAGQPLEVAAPTPVQPRGAARAEPTGWSPPQADFEGAGVGWRRPTKERSAEAQAFYERALAEIRAGQVNGAIALLRQALACAPGDSEIAETLGKLAFRDRTPGAR